MIEVFFPSQREAPGFLLRRLREIDPKAHVVWLRDQAWCLGTMVPKKDRLQMAYREILSLKAKGGAGMQQAEMNPVKRRQLERQHEEKLAFWKLKAQGFVEQGTFEGPDHVAFPAMVNWLTEAKHVQQHSYERSFQAWEHSMVEQDMEGEARTAFERELTDEYRLKEAWRYSFKRPVSVQGAGIPHTTRYIPGVGRAIDTGHRITPSGQAIQINPTI